MSGRLSVHASWAAWYRDRNGCTWEWLAGQLKLTATMLGKYRAGEASPAEATWRRIAKWIGRHELGRGLTPAEYWAGPPPAPGQGDAALRAQRLASLRWAADERDDRPSLRMALRFAGWADDALAAWMRGAMEWHGLIDGDAAARAALPERLLALSMDQLGEPTEADRVLDISSGMPGASGPELGAALVRLVSGVAIVSEMRGDALMISLRERDRFDPMDANKQFGSGPAWASDDGMVGQLMPGRTARIFAAMTFGGSAAEGDLDVDR